jgi:hypothetical protein
MIDQIIWVARYKISGRYAFSSGTYAGLYRKLEWLDVVDDVTIKIELWRGVR